MPSVAPISGSHSSIGVPKKSRARPRSTKLPASMKSSPRFSRTPENLDPIARNCKEIRMQLGMVGLGRMGSNMVRRLIRGGHECVVFDVFPKAVEDLAKEKATGASSL